MTRRPVDVPEELQAGSWKLYHPDSDNVVIMVNGIHVLAPVGRHNTDEADPNHFLLSFYDYESAKQYLGAVCVADVGLLAECVPAFVADNYYCIDAWLPRQENWLSDVLGHSSDDHAVELQGLVETPDGLLPLFSMEYHDALAFNRRKDADAAVEAINRLWYLKAAVRHRGQQDNNHSVINKKLLHEISAFCVVALSNVYFAAGRHWIAVQREQRVITVKKEE